MKQMLPVLVVVMMVMMMMMMSSSIHSNTMRLLWEQGLGQSNRLESDLSRQSFQLLVMGLEASDSLRILYSLTKTAVVVGKMMVPKMEDPLASP
jgi:hypothetical protein